MNKILFPLLIAVCISTTGCATAKSELKDTGKTMINLEKTKTYCLGRYAVEIPAEANPLKRYDKYDSFTITVKENATRQDFDAAVEKWRKDYSKGDRKIFEDPQEQKFEGRSTKIFKGKLEDDKRLPFMVAAFVLDKRTLFLIEGGHSDTPKWTAESNEAIQNLVKNLRYRPEHEIPKEAGQCIYMGFIRDEKKQYRYSIQTLAFDFNNYPSVVLRFESESNDDVVLPLIPRIEKELRGVGQSERQINKGNIRKGEKNTEYLTAQEWIGVEKMKGRDGISALWEHTGTASDNTDPLINFEVDTSYESFGNKSSSLYQVEAMQLYESIIKTIRKF